MGPSNVRSKEEVDRIVRERERREITGISRTTAFVLERKGKFPKRLHVTGGRCGWRLSDLQEWVATRRYVNEMQEAAVASDRRIQLPDVAPVSDPDTESGANVSQGVTAGRDRQQGASPDVQDLGVATPGTVIRSESLYRPSASSPEDVIAVRGGNGPHHAVTAGRDRHRRPSGQLGGSGAASHQGRGGSPDEVTVLENRTETQASTTTLHDAAGPGCAGQPDQPEQRLNPAFIDASTFSGPAATSSLAAPPPEPSPAFLPRAACRCGRTPFLHVDPWGHGVVRAVLSCSCPDAPIVARLGLGSWSAIRSVVARWNTQMDLVRGRKTMPKITLGQVVKDKITGFEGTATGRVEYLTGCTQVLVQPRVDESGKLIDSAWMDESRMEIVTADPLRIDVPAGNPGADKPAPRC